MAVALKLSKGPIVYALQKYDFIVLFPVNPVTLARYRQAFTPSGAKDDPSDAELALDLLVCHRDKFAPLQPQSAPMRTLIHLVEQRRQLVNDKLRFTNRIGNALKQYYRRHWPGLSNVIRLCSATLSSVGQPSPRSNARIGLG